MTDETNNLPQQSRATGADSVRERRMARPLRETVKRMDCPSVMREHLWSVEREGMIECLWCFERRRSEDRERPSEKLRDAEPTTGASATGSKHEN